MWRWGGLEGGIEWGKGEGGRRTERPHDLRQSRRERGGVEVAHRGARHVLVAGAVECSQLREVEHRHLDAAEIRGEVRRCGHAGRATPHGLTRLGANGQGWGCGVGRGGCEMFGTPWISHWPWWHAWDHAWRHAWR